METSAFFAYSWHQDETETDVTTIRAYGLNKQNENVCVIINDFTPYIYLELPNEIEWTEGKAQILVDRLNFLLRDKKPIKTQLMFKQRLYYASVDKNGKKKVYPYLMCAFSHSEDMRQLSYKVRNPVYVQGLGNLRLKMHEHNAGPILQLTSLRKLPTAGWIKFRGRRVKKEDQITHCTHEYSINWRTTEEEISDKVPRPYIMGFDLEVNSSIPSSMPKANRTQDKIFQISCVFWRHGDKIESMEKILLTLGKITKKIEDIETICFDTEADLLVGFTELVQKKQPNILIGYNIFQFDIPYMIDRAKYGLCLKEFDRIGMMKYAHAKEKSISWSSSAYKNQSFQYLDAEGRIFVDLLPLVKRDNKMSNYRLETIAAHFLKGATKDPLTHKDIFRCYAVGMKGGSKGEEALALCGKYCVQDSALVVRLFNVLTTWIGLCQMSKVTGVPIFSLYTQGQQIKVFSQVYRKATHENTVVEKDAYVASENDYYVGATVFPPVPGVYENVVPFDFCLTGDTLVTMADWTSKRLDKIEVGDDVIGWYKDTFSSYKVIRALQRGEKQTVDVWFLDCTVIHVTPEHKFMLTNGEWCEAKDLKGKLVKGLRDKRVARVISGQILPVYDIEVETAKNFLANGVCVSNCSLYPSAIIAYNISWDTLVLDDSIPDEKTTLTYWYDHQNCCVSGDTLISTDMDSREIRYMVGNKDQLLSFSSEEKGLILSNQVKFYDQGQKECIELIFEDGRKLVCTPDHKILDVSGDWIEAKDMLERRAVAYTKNNYSSLKVLSIKPVGMQHVYDLEVKDTHNFLANGIVVHNCHDPKVIRKEELNRLIKQREVELKAIRTERDKKENKDKKEEFKKKIVDFIKAMKPLRDERVQLNKSKPKHIICQERKFRWLKSPMGVLPEVLTHLLDTRAATKKEMKGIKAKLEAMKDETKKKLLTERKLEGKELDTALDEWKETNTEYTELAVYQDVLDQRQLALKVSANSVTGDTAIPCRLDGKFCYRTIDSLSQIDWDEKGRATPLEGLEVWSDKGFTKVLHVFRHKPNTEIVRVNTHRGVVDCTEHHSLLRANGEEVRPVDIAWNDELMHVATPLPDDTPSQPLYNRLTYDIIKNHPLETIEEKQAFIWGLFFVEGKCGEKMWAIYSEDVNIQSHTQNILQEIEPGNTFNIYRYGLEVIDPSAELIEKYKKLARKIPDEITTSAYRIRLAFLLGAYAGCGDKNVFAMTCRGNSIDTAVLAYIVKSVGYTRVINYEDGVYYLQFRNKSENYVRIRSISTPYIEYVYDLETENHHFAAGIGDLIVHNSGYGITGTRKGYLPCMPVAMTTTYMGRCAIEKAAEKIQKDYGGKLVYGDSVTPDTPLLCRLKDGTLTYKTIDTIKSGKWKQYRGDKEIALPIKGIQVWTENGFTPIKQVIRHKCQKKIYQVLANSGVVHVTEDHSLLDEDGKELTPKDIHVGSKLLTAELPISEINRCDVSEGSAEACGEFFAKDTSRIISEIIMNCKKSIRQAYVSGILQNSNRLVVKNKLTCARLYYLMKSVGYSVSINDGYILTCTKDQSSSENLCTVKDISVYSDDYTGYVYDLETENHHFSAGIGQIIVHNTDSNYVSFPEIKDLTVCWDTAVMIAKEVSKIFPKPMSLAFEDVIYSRFLILTKKRYMSLKASRDGKVDSKIAKKGVLLSRRDNSDFVRSVYSGVVMMVFNQNSREEILYYIITELNKLCSASIPTDQFVITKSVGDMGWFEGERNTPITVRPDTNDKGKQCHKIGDYTVRKLLPTDPERRQKELERKECKTPEEYYLHSLPPQAQLADKMRKRGQLVAAGSRIEYVITTTGGHTAHQYVKIESIEYFRRHKRVLEIDYLYYLKQLTNPLDQVLDAIFHDPDTKGFTMKQYKYRVQVRGKVMQEIRSLSSSKLVI